MSEEQNAPVSEEKEVEAQEHEKEVAQEQEGQSPEQEDKESAQKREEDEKEARKKRYRVKVTGIYHMHPYFWGSLKAVASISIPGFTIRGIRIVQEKDEEGFRIYPPQGWVGRQEKSIVKIHNKEFWAYIREEVGNAYIVSREKWENRKKKGKKKEEGEKSQADMLQDQALEGQDAEAEAAKAEAAKAEAAQAEATPQETKAEAADSKE